MTNHGKTSFKTFKKSIKPQASRILASHGVNHLPRTAGEITDNSIFRNVKYLKWPPTGKSIVCDGSIQQNAIQQRR